MSGLDRKDSMSKLEDPTLGYFHVPQDSLRKGSAREADPSWPSYDVVHRRDYEQRVLERDDALRRLSELEQENKRMREMLYREPEWPPDFYWSDLDARPVYLPQRGDASGKDGDAVDLAAPTTSGSTDASCTCPWGASGAHRSDCPCAALSEAGGTDG